MADGGDGLAGGGHVSRQVDHRVSHAHALGGIPARDDERIEVAAGGCARRDVRGDDVAAFACVLPRSIRRDERHDCARGL